MPPLPPRRRRARPVADDSVEGLLLRCEDLTKGWLLALLEQSSLDEAPGILAADLAHDGPRICRAVLRAIVSDADLNRLERDGTLRPLTERVGELTGARAHSAISRAVDALQGVLWSALRDELRQPEPDAVFDLSERLALVAELLREAALEGAVPPDAGPRAAEHRAVVWPLERRRSEADAADRLWVGELEDEIRKSAGSTLSLLIAELEDADQVRAARMPSGASEIFARFEDAVRSAVRRRDILVRESYARVWIIARETARAGAYALGERIAAAVRDSEAWHGAPLIASVGIAVLGEDGRSAAELIDAAEEARFGAAASGLRVLRSESRPARHPDPRSDDEDPV